MIAEFTLNDVGSMNFEEIWNCGRGLSNLDVTISWFERDNGNETWIWTGNDADLNSERDVGMKPTNGRKKSKLFSHNFEANAS